MSRALPTVPACNARTWYANINRMAASLFDDLDELVQPCRVRVPFSQVMPQVHDEFGVVIGPLGQPGEHLVATGFRQTKRQRILTVDFTHVFPVEYEERNRA